MEENEREDVQQPGMFDFMKGYFASNNKIFEKFFPIISFDFFIFNEFIAMRDSLQSSVYCQEN